MFKRLDGWDGLTGLGLAAALATHQRDSWWQPSLLRRDLFGGARGTYHSLGLLGVWRAVYWSGAELH